MDSQWIYIWVMVSLVFILLYFYLEQSTYFTLPPVSDDWYFLGFEISVVLSDGSGTQNVLAKKLILAPGAYANLNSWIRVKTKNFYKAMSEMCEKNCFGMINTIKPNKIG